MLDHFPTSLSVIRLVSLQTNMTYRGSFSEHPVSPETGSPAYMQTRLAQSSANTIYSATLSFLGCPMHPTSSWVNERSSQYLIHLVKFTNIQPHDNIITKKKRKKKNQTKHISIKNILIT